MKVERPVKSGAITGAAWLSSARGLRCSLKWGNERNHYPLLPLTSSLLDVKHSKETAWDNQEEGGDDVKSARPLCPGRHTCYNGYDRGLPTREGELIS